MKSKNSAKIRVNFRKNRGKKTRQTDITRDLHRGTFTEDDVIQNERISGKGSMTRQRTIVVEVHEDADVDTNADAASLLSVVDGCRRGIVLRVHGLNTLVEDEQTGRLFRCTIRRLLKTLATDQRHVVVVGDFVQFRPADEMPQEEQNAANVQDATTASVPTPATSWDAVNVRLETLPEGMIERIENRYGCLCRTSYGRKHTLVANVDQIVIVTSLAEPTMKRNLIDRMILTAEKMDVRPIICVNKWDLGSDEDRLAIVPVMGVYARMGYDIFPVSARTGQGVPRLRQILHHDGVRSVVAGQSGVGKSSLLNAVEPGLGLLTGHVSEQTQKGRHTTVSAQLIRLTGGGYVVDTPGIRQFSLWDVIPEEVPGFFRDIRPLVSLCKFDDCTHTHEDGCAVREAVELEQLDPRRYESCLQIASDS